MIVSQTASAANPGTIAFQGKVVNADGTNVANGTYSVVFRLYYNITPATYNPNALACASDTNCYWEETQPSVSVNAGVFQVELGSVCAFTSACNSGHSGIDFNALNNLSLTMKFNGDANGYMAPLMHFNSVPYALNSDKVGGLSASQLARNDTSNTFAAAQTVQQSSTTALLVQASASNAVLSVDTSGNHLVLGKPGSSGINVNIVFNNATNANQITLGVADGTAGYSLTLPSVAPSTAQCLKSGTSTAGLLEFGSCSVGGSSSLQTSYTTSAGASPSITVDSTNLGLTIQNSNASPITGELFGVHDKTASGLGNALFSVADTGAVAIQPGTDSTTELVVKRSSTNGSTAVLTVDTSNSQTTLRGINSDATLGSELTNTSFSNTNFTNAGWVAGAGWSKANGSATHTAGSANTLTWTTTAPTASTTYEVLVTVSGMTNKSGSSSVSISLGGVSGSSSMTANGNYGFIITTANTNVLTITPTANWSGSVQNVSAQALTAATPLLTLQTSSGSASVQAQASSVSGTFYGLQSGRYNSTGTMNTGFGYQALQNTATGPSNTAIGATAMQNNVTGFSNTAVGYQALQSNLGGSTNVAVGEHAVGSNRIGVGNVGIGYYSVSSNTTGSSNVGIGNNALLSTNGSSNVGVGSNALTYLAGFNGSISAITGNGVTTTVTTSFTAGLTTGNAVTIDSTTNFNGTYSITVLNGTQFTFSSAVNATESSGLWYTANTDSNVAIGFKSGYGGASYTATGNALLGYQTGLSLQNEANYNTLLGYSAGSAVTTGAQNLLLGYNAGTNLTSGSSNIIIGAGTSALNATGSNQLNIGNVLFGNVDPTTPTNRQVYIKTTNSAAFQIQNAAGEAVLVTDTTTNNLITNAGFENNSQSGWATTTTTGTGHAVAVTSTASNVYLGSYAAQVTTASNAANTGAKVTSFTTSITPGTYTLSFYTMGGATNGNFSTLNVNVVGGGAPACLTAVSVNTSGYTRYTCTFVSTSTNITEIDFVSSDAATQHIFYLDGVQLMTSATEQGFLVNGSIRLPSVINGPVTLQSETNSTNAFQVQNANGSPIFLVDTTNTTNLITNPGFEVGVSGWTGSGGNSPGCVQNATKTNTYCGLASLDCTLSTTAATTTATVNSFTQTIPNGTYTFSFYAKATGTVTLGANATFTGGGGTCALNNVTISTSFQRYQCTVTTTTGNTTAISITTTTLSQHVYIDSVQLQTGSTATPYYIGGIQLRGVITNPVSIQNSSDSTNEFQVANAAGLRLLTVDSESVGDPMEVQVGQSATDANAVLLGLDSYNQTTEPTEVDGEMYYNSAMADFRCGTNGAWASCGINNIDHTWVLQDEFLSGAYGTASAATVGGLNWNYTVTGTTGCTISYNQTGPALAHDHPGTMKLLTNVTSANGCIISEGGTAAGTVTLAQVLGAGDVLKSTIAIGVQTGSVRIGWSNQTSATAPTSGAWVQYVNGTDATHWFFCTANNAAANCAAFSPTQTATVNTWYRIEIRVTSGAVGGITFLITPSGGSTVTATNASVADIGATNKLSPMYSCYTSTTTANSCYIDYFQWRGVSTTTGGR